MLQTTFYSRPICLRTIALMASSVADCNSLFTVLEKMLNASLFNSTPMMKWRRLSAIGSWVSPVMGFTQAMFAVTGTDTTSIFPLRRRGLKRPKLGMTPKAVKSMLLFTTDLTFSSYKKKLSTLTRLPPRKSSISSIKKSVRNLLPFLSVETGDTEVTFNVCFFAPCKARSFSLSSFFMTKSC